MKKATSNFVSNSVLIVYCLHTGRLHWFNHARILIWEGITKLVNCKDINNLKQDYGYSDGVYFNYFKVLDVIRDFILMSIGDLNYFVVCLVSYFLETVTA